MWVNVLGYILSVDSVVVGLVGIEFMLCDIQTMVKFCKAPRGVWGWGEGEGGGDFKETVQRCRFKRKWQRKIDGSYFCRLGRIWIHISNIRIVAGFLGLWRGKQERGILRRHAKILILWCSRNPINIMFWSYHPDFYSVYGRFQSSIGLRFKSFRFIHVLFGALGHHLSFCLLQNFVVSQA